MTPYPLGCGAYSSICSTCGQALPERTYKIGQTLWNGSYHNMIAHVGYPDMVQIIEKNGGTFMSLPVAVKNRFQITEAEMKEITKGVPFRMD